MFSTRSRLIALAAVVAVPAASFAQFAGVLPPPERYEKGFLAIDEDLAFKHLSFLAGPECEGRGTGQPGFMVAANYVAEQFKAMGLEPIGDDGTYYQGVPYSRTSADPAGTYLVGPSFSAKLGQGMSLSGASGDFELDSADVVFVNMKSSGDAIPDDLELNGKVVVLTIDGGLGRLSNTLRRRGAALVINVVNKPGPVASRFGRASSGPSRNTARPPTVSLARSKAHALARALGADTRIVTAGFANGDSIVSETGAGKLSLKVTIKRETVMVPNVVGYLPGTDPELKAQYIGVGAHLDHNGVINGVVYPGADDDGSGTTAMLLVARAITSNPVRPKRSVVFMAFSGEEMGLVGSRYYTDNPIIPLEQMDCLLQMDMVGRNEELGDEKPEDNVDTIHLIGSKRISMELHDITIEANKHIGFTFEYDEEDVYSRSDHANFARKGVPITFLFSGFHPDYHRPTDTVDKINFHKIVSSARLNYLVVQQVASLPNMVVRDVEGGL